MQYDDPRFTFIFSKLIQMAKGDLTRHLKIGKANDAIDTISALLNMLSENWSERILHIPFVKEERRPHYLQLFSLSTDVDLNITEISDFGLSMLQLHHHDIRGKSLLLFLDADSQQQLQILLNKPHEISYENHKVVLKFNHLNVLLFYEAHVQYSSISKRYWFSFVGIRYRPMLPAYEEKKYKSRMIQRNYIDLKIQKVYDYLNSLDNFSNVNHQMLCRKFHINEQLLKSKFKELYKISVYQYQLRVRMLRARELVVNTSLPFKNISLKAGFKNYSNFSRNFKSFFNTTPNKLRKRYQL